MSFSLRKMLSNINYFKKPDENSENGTSESHIKIRRDTYVLEDPIVINFESAEPDSTSRQCTSLKLPESVKNFAAKKGSFSDTDLLTLSIEAPVKEKRRKCKKLKLDIKKASQSMNQLSEDSFNNVENTPKQKLLECHTSDVFCERFRGFDFNKSFDLIDVMSDGHSNSFLNELEIDSLTDESDTDASVASKKSSIKMCRRVKESTSSEDHLIPSTSLESFSDVESDKSEEERIKLLLDYQTKLDRMETFLKKMLHEFQFHIEVSKVFRSKSIVTQSVTKKNKQNSSPVASWNLIMEKEDLHAKYKVKKQLQSIKSSIEDFIKIYLQTNKLETYKHISFNAKHRNSIQKRSLLKHKKKYKYFDFPDLREAMMNLFSLEDIEVDSSFDESDLKCICKCHQPESPPSPTDSVNNKNSSMSITSSIGNFSLDSSTLTAYSESLDQIVSYNSFQDTSLYNTLLQKAAIERITFYIQVHSIELKCEEENELKTIKFHCPSCKDTHIDENSLLRHILSQSHCEKIHFIYKTAYIKKCMSSGKEIQPSSVLNPMKLYRDDNKIVCFGDAVYACSLCFENLIVGESVLMAHCSEPQHVERRDRLDDICG